MKNKLKGTLVGSAILLGAIGLTSCDLVKIEKSVVVIQAPQEEQQIVEKILKQYNDTHSNQFSYKFSAVAEGDAVSKMGTKEAAQAEDAPNLLLCADDQISLLLKNEVVKEITGDAKTFVVKNNTPGSVNCASYDSRLYGYPVSNDNGYFLWYDTEIFTKVDNVNSLENILAVCRAKNKKFYMPINNGWYANSFIMSPQACGTTSIQWHFDSATQKAVYETSWADEQAVKVSEYIGTLLKDAYDDGILDIGLTQEEKDEGIEGNQHLLDGAADKSIIAAVSGTWMAGEGYKAFADRVNSGSISATKLPEYHIENDAYQMASFSGSRVYVVNSLQPEDEIEAALEIAKLITGKDAQLERLKVRKLLPCNTDAMLDQAYLNSVSVGNKALNAQSVFACSQSKAVEDRYWDIGASIGQAYIDGKLMKKTLDESGNSIPIEFDKDNKPSKYQEEKLDSWAEFLAYKMGILTVPSTKEEDAKK